MTAATAEFLAEHGLNMDELLAPSDNDVDDDDIVGNKSSGPAELGYTPWEEERLDSLLFDHPNCQYTVRQFAHAMLQIKTGCTGFHDGAADQVCKLFKEIFSGSCRFKGPGCVNRTRQTAIMASLNVQCNVSSSRFHWSACP
jgi:hypothetical protein